MQACTFRAMLLNRKSGWPLKALRFQLRKTLFSCSDYQTRECHHRYVTDSFLVFYKPLSDTSYLSRGARRITMPK